MRIKKVKTCFLIVLLAGFISIEGQSQNIYDDFYQSWYYGDFLEDYTGGGGSATYIRIEDDVLTFYYNAGFNSSRLKIGSIKYLNTNPPLDDLGYVGLGQINTSASGQAQYYVAIHDGYVFIQRSGPPPDPSVTFANCNLSVNLRDAFCSIYSSYLPTSFNVSSTTCGNKTLTKSGSIPSDEMWYWQGTNPNGTNENSGRNAANNSFTATSSGTYYLRAISDEGCWSNSRGISVTVNSVPINPPVPEIEFNDCNGIKFTRNGTPESGVSWHWKWGLSEESLGTGSNFTISSTEKTRIYLVAINDGSGCSALNHSSLSFEPYYKPSSNNNTDFNYVKTEIAQRKTTSEANFDGYCAEGKLTSFGYKDGLGRDVQSVLVAHSPNSNDIVEAISYNEFGDVEISYLPYSSTSNDGSYKTFINQEIADFYSSQSYVAHDNAPYIKNILEHSPLRRLKVKGAPGIYWQPEIAADYSRYYNWSEFTEVDAGGGGSVGVTTEGTILTISFSAGFTNSRLETGNVVLLDIPLPDMTLGTLNVGGYVVRIVDQYLNISGSTEEIGGFNKKFYIDLAEYGLTGQNPNAISFSYEVNTLADAVANHTIVAGTNLLEFTNVFEAGRLRKNITKDEHNNVIQEYIDLEGRTILKRVQAHETGSPEEWADTYYIYDERGNLRYVLPPEAVKAIGSPSDGQIISTIILVNWAFQYKYDGRNRMIEKKVPGADWVYMIYDNRDRLVLTQDGKQRDTSIGSGREWLFTKYDGLNRPISTGLYVHNTVLNQSQMQQVVNTFYDGGTVTNWYEELNLAASHHGYTNRSFPSAVTGTDYLTVTYYDNYYILGQSDFNGDYSYSSPSGCQNTLQGNYCYNSSPMAEVNGQVTVSKIKVLGTNQWVNSAIYYDDRYRTIQVTTKNLHLGSVEKVNSLFNFSGWLLESYKEQVAHGFTMAVKTRYEYDHVGRLMRGYHELFDNGVGQGEVLLAENSYNELGELIEKNLHVENNTPQQSLDYRYNIRGWLESINNASLNPSSNNNPNDDNKDYFGMELIYQNVIPGLTD